MPRDRMKDFRAEVAANKRLSSAKSSQSSSSISSSSSSETDRERDQTRFSNVEEMKRNIESIRMMTKRLQELQVRSINQVIENDPKVREEMDAIIAKVKKMANFSNQELKKMDQIIENEREAAQRTVNPAPASLRRKEIQRSAMLKTFVEAMNSFRNTQDQFKMHSVQQVRRHMKIATGEDIQDDEAMDILKEGTLVFHRNLLIEKSQATKMLKDVQRRHDELEKLQRSIEEMHDLFLDLQIMIEQQGERIDTIGGIVNSTRNWIEEGTVKLEEAKIEKKSYDTTKRRCYLIIGGIVLITITALVLFFVFIFRQSDDENETDKPATNIP